MLSETYKCSKVDRKVELQIDMYFERDYLLFKKIEFVNNNMQDHPAFEKELNINFSKINS